jgi:(p)ppGpp synthase/HD superfamily hydrolase
MTEHTSMPTWNPELFLDAYRYAARAHGNQRMPGKDRFPYAVHISTVAMELCAALTVDTFSKPNLAVQCAILHDTLEDTNTDHASVVQTFGAAVADGVLALTKDHKLPKPDAMADSLRRIKEQPHEVWAVKLADRITNLQPPPENWSQMKRQAYSEEAQIILDALGSCSPYLAARLSKKIATYRSRYCGA